MSEPETFLLMNDDATVTPLTRCDDCRFLFRDIEKHVAESVTVLAVEPCRSCARGNHRGCHDMRRRLPRDICCCGLDAVEATPKYSERRNVNG